MTENLIDPEAFTQEWSTYVAKGKNHRYGLCFTWDIANIDNNTDYVMLPALTGPDGMRNITRQNNSETSGFDRGRCVLTSSCRNTALALHGLIRCMHHFNHHRITGELMEKRTPLTFLNCPQTKMVEKC